MSAKGNASIPNSANLVTGTHNKAWGSNQTVMGTYADASAGLSFAVGAGKEGSPYNAFSIDKFGVVKQGGGFLIEKLGAEDIQQDVYEEINGQLTKITI